MPDINGIPYVEATDLVSAYPGVSLALATELDDQLAAKLAVAGGKILQIVRATDGTQRTTTSTSFTDVTGMAVTITPQKSDSALLIISTFSNPTFANSPAVSENRRSYQITDSGNNSLSGAHEVVMGTFDFTFTASGEIWAFSTLIGHSTPATTSAVTYKLRFKTNNANTTNRVRNDLCAGQMYAIEVSA